MNELEFIDDRNSQLKGTITPCLYCGETFPNYMAKVYHRRDSHKIPPGVYDVWDATDHDRALFDNQMFDMTKKVNASKTQQSLP